MSDCPCIYALVVYFGGALLQDLGCHWVEIGGDHHNITIAVYLNIKGH